MDTNKDASYWSSEDFFLQILQQLPIHVFWKNREGVYMGCNNAFAHSLGLSSPKDVVGKSDFDLPVDKEMSKKYVADDEDVMESCLPKLNIQEQQKLSDGCERYLLTSKIPLVDSTVGKVMGVLCLYSDITELKEVQLELERVSKLALEKHHQFLENQQHDIITPLAGIVGGLQIIKPLVKDPQAQEFFGYIEVSSEELFDYDKGLLRDLEWQQGKGRIAIQRFDLPELVSRVHNLNLAAAKTKNLKYCCNIDASIPKKLCGDKLRIYQSLLNLLSNAVQFTSEGCIDLEVKLLSQQDRQVTIKFSIKDTGIGVSEDLQEAIFEEFVKVKPSNRGGKTGRGLGLSLTQKYVKAMGGELNLASKLGEGSTFSIVLPLDVSLDQSDDEA